MTLLEILFLHKKRLIGVADIGKSVNDDIYNTYILRDWKSNKFCWIVVTRQTFHDRVFPWTQHAEEVKLYHHAILETVRKFVVVLISIPWI